MCLPLVALGSTSLRSFLTRSSVAREEGEVFEVTVKTAALPFLLTRGYVTLSTPLVFLMSLRKSVRRGSEAFDSRNCSFWSSPELFSCLAACCLTCFSIFLFSWACFWSACFWIDWFCFLSSSWAC